MADKGREAELADKVRGTAYPGLRSDLEWLADYYAQSGDKTCEFHARKRLERLAGG